MSNRGETIFKLDFLDLVSVEVLVKERRIIERLVEPDTPQTTVDHILLDQVLPRLIAHGGTLTLHAGAITCEDGAILFIGESGRGKSTLSASFAQAGNSILSDDALSVSEVAKTPHAQAIYPSLRLLPDSLEALYPPGVKSEPIAHYTTKQRIEVPWGRKHVGQPLPIAAIMILGDQPADGSISMRHMAKAEACMALITNSFALDPTDRERAAQKLAQASRVAITVPTFEISYPREYSKLSKVRAAILAKVGAH